MSEFLHLMETWRQGLGVRRFHTWPTIGEQTVGHHSCGVALIIVMCHPNPSGALLSAAVTHDLSEGVLGDLPATTKWRNPALQAEWHKLERDVDTALGLPMDQLNEQDSASLLLADALEGLLFCREQLRLGNLNYRVVADNWIKHLGSCKLWGTAPVAFEELYAELHNWFNPTNVMEVLNVPGLS